MDSLLFIPVFFVIVAIATLVFGLWFVVSVLRMAGRGVAAMFGLMHSPHRPSIGPAVCPRPGCKAINPHSARFCRRCGQEILRGRGVWV